jgi:hypothetical protein
VNELKKKQKTKNEEKIRFQELGINKTSGQTKQESKYEIKREEALFCIIIS